MQQKEKQPEFSLEDILREFGSHPEDYDTPAETESAEAAPQPPADHGPDLIPIADEDRVPLEQPQPAPQPAPQIPEMPAAQPAPLTPQPAEEDEEDVQIFVPQKTERPVSGDTVRLDGDALRKAVGQAQADASAMDGKTVRIDTAAVSAMSKDTACAMDGETVRLDTAAVSALSQNASRVSDSMNDETVAFSPVSEEAAPAADPAGPEGAEPFSAGWEPTYEEPMGEYVPPEPIVFRPRSRFQELKKKLIAGPERRYYALVEAGVGKLQVAIFISLLIVLLSTVSIVLNQMNLVQPQRMRLLVFGELFAMMFSAVLASDLLFKGIVSIFRGRFTLNSLLAMSFIVCMLDGIFCLKGVRVPYCAAFCLEVTFALWSEYQQRNTEMGQMDTLRKATHLNRLARAPGCFEDRAGFFVENGEVEDFMDSYNRPGRPQKAMGIYAFLAFLASAAIGIVTFVTGHDLSAAMQMWSAAILAAAPATIFICQSRPAAIVERRLHRFGVVLCGWKGVRGACGKVVVPLADTDLCPAGTVKVNGVKFYSKRDPDQIIGYTTALVELSATGMAPLFSQLLDSRYGQHYHVENFRVYESGGLGGEVCGETVLVGTMSFLQEQGIRLPEGAGVHQAVYSAIGGELSGVFAMAFGKLKGVSAGLTAICAQRKLTPMIVTNNFLVTDAFLREKFGINTKKVLFPTAEQRSTVTAWTPDRDQAVACALSTQESLAATGFAISGARSLATATRMGTIMHLFGGIVGLLIVLVLQFVDGGSLLTPANLLLFELIWSVPGLLLTEWTRGL